MKRAGLVIFCIILAGGVFFLWWFLRDTPEKALAEGLKNLFAAKTVQSAVIDITWSDPATRVTTGIDLAGQIDLKDLTRPRVLGVVRASEGFLGPDEQTADMVLEADRIALRPRSVPQDVRQRYEALTGDAQDKTFAIIRRDPYLDGHGLSDLIAHKPSDDIRALLPSFAETVRVAGPWTKETVGGRQVVTVPFTVDPAAFRPFLVSFVKTWVGDNPTPDELRWIDGLVSDLSRGTFALTVDRSSRLPERLQAEWPLLDADGKETVHVVASILMDGVDKPVAIAIPDGSKDVTDLVLTPRTTTATLPSAALKPLPVSAFASGTIPGMEEGVYATGTYSTATRQFINEKDTDLFHRYMEEINSSTRTQ